LTFSPNAKNASLMIIMITRAATNPGSSFTKNILRLKFLKIFSILSTSVEAISQKYLSKKHGQALILLIFEGKFNFDSVSVTALINTGLFSKRVKSIAPEKSE